MNWPSDLAVFKKIRGKIKFAEPLSRHTTFSIGGPAKLFICPLDLADLKTALIFLKPRKIPFLILGAGSNILAVDRGVQAAVIKLNAPFFKTLKRRGNNIEAASGVSLSELLRFTRRNNLGGLEFLTGIPGSVGGALAMNAGALGSSIGNLVAQVKVLDYNNKVKILKSKEINFVYRQAHLAKYIILGATFKLFRQDKKIIEKKINAARAYRRITQDYSRPSAGCVFRNPGEQSAGRLIDLCGLKGRKIGRACVSLKHANFILNTTSAKAGDVLRLMRLIKSKVEKRFNIKLEPEVRIWK